MQPNQLSIILEDTESEESTLTEKDQIDAVLSKKKALLLNVESMWYSELPPDIPP